jgi:alpha-N-arabinofuranosidase
MANMAQLVNVIAPIVTDPDRLLLQSIYHPLRLCAEHVREVALDPLVVCETVAHADPPGAPWPHRVGDLGPFALLDVAATRDAAATALTVTVVNRSPEAAVPVVLELGRTASEATWHLVNGESPDAVNTFEEPDRVSVQTCQVPTSGSRVELTLPAHSFSALVISLDNRA